MPTGTHGSDLIASSYQAGLTVADMLKSYIDNIDDSVIALLDTIIATFANIYQRYFAGHALSRDPNKLMGEYSQTWEIADDGDGMIYNALKAGLITHNRKPFFEFGADRESAAKNCNFWNEIAQEIGKLFSEENSSGDGSGVSKGLFGVQVQDPEKGTPVIPDL